MVVHHCIRCGYKSTRKTLWRGHLKRKKTCKAKFIDISREEILENYELYIDDYLSMISTDEEYSCKDCSFSSKYIFSYNRHVQNNVCGRANGCEKSEIEELKERIRILELQNRSQTAPITNNVVNNNVGRDQNIQNNIVNNFGKEDLSSFTIERWLKIGECPPEAIARLVEEIHFKTPCNDNIDIPNIRGNYGKIYKNNAWTYIKLGKLLEDLLSNNHNRFYDFLESNRDILPPRWVDGIDKMLDTIEIGNDKVRNEQKDKIKYAVLNNRNND